MIDSNSGIEAYIRPYDSTGQYHEYEAPRGSPAHTGKPRERYIEAVAGQRFEMVVILRSTFDFKGKSHLEVEYDIDGGTMNFSKNISSERHRAGKSCGQLTRYVYRQVNGLGEFLGFVFRETSLGMSRHFV